MTPLIVSFWVCVGCVLYPYVVYPLLLAVLARLRARPTRREEGLLPAVSVVLCAYNEETTIGRRVAELLKLLDFSGVRGELIVVSDGSSDDTAAVARQYDGVRVLELPHNGGKAAALSAGCAVAANEILVFADTRQTWAPDALRLLLENFADPTVGAVSGDLHLESRPGVTAGLGLYWRYEKWIRRQESKLHSTVGVTGAISAVRRELFQPLPAGTILDDVYWPLAVAMQGRRVVHDSRARAYDRLPEKAGDEFRRKVRTLSGNFQLCALLPAALLPWRNPLWFQFVSHKLCRLLAPWALLALLPLAATLDGVPYRLAFWGQVALYGLALAGTLKAPASRLVTSAGSFVLLNAAAWLAFWVWLSGRAGRSWHKVQYECLPQPSLYATLKSPLNVEG